MCEREYTAQKIVELLRRCGTNCNCAGCQMYDVAGSENALKGHAANMIEEQAAELAELNAEYTLVIKHRDELAEEVECITAHRDAIAEDQKHLHERCQAQQNEINALVLRLGKQEDKTDQPPICHEVVEKVGALIARANYQKGRADALEAFITRYFFEEVHPNE